MKKFAEKVFIYLNRIGKIRLDTLPPPPVILLFINRLYRFMLCSGDQSSFQSGANNDLLQEQVYYTIHLMYELHGELASKLWQS
jgi:hypothetical protein